MSEYFELWDDMLVLGRWMLQGPYADGRKIVADLVDRGLAPSPIQ